MKRTIAIVAGGDSSEHGVSMKSAEGIYSFIDQDKYTLYIVELTKARWEAILSDGSRAQVAVSYTHLTLPTILLV